MILYSLRGCSYCEEMHSEEFRSEDRNACKLLFNGSTKDKIIHTHKHSGRVSEMAKHLQLLALTGAIYFSFSLCLKSFITKNWGKQYNIVSIL